MSTTIRIVILFVLHTVGIIGFCLPQYQSLFVRITPIHLMIISIVLFWEKSSLDWKFFVFALLSFGIGFGAEILGVSKHIIFGHYHYTSALSFSFMGVPYIIGLLWISTSYACNQISMVLFPHTQWISIVGAALLMTGFDFMIEPFATKYGLWLWHNGIIPDLNYYSWFGVGLVISIIYHKLFGNKSNAISAYFLLTQIVFFVVLKKI